MRFLSLLVLLSLTADASPRPRFERFCSRTQQGRTDRGFLDSSMAELEAFPANGLGVPAECTCTQASVVAAGVLYATTTSRSTGAYCTKADYSGVLCAANQMRVMTGGGPNLPLGVMSEFTVAQNVALQARDFSNAAHVKTNATCTKTASGWDGVTNSASTCTASAANGTVLQTVAVTGQYAAALRIKRRTGTGTVSVTVDGTNFTDITARLSSSIFKRVANTETTGCMYGGCIVVRAMAANFASSPAIGIKLATSGDAVDLDMEQLETGYFSTSDWPTTTVADTRAIETHSVTGLPPLTVRSVSYLTVSTGWPTAVKYSINGSIQSDANNEFLYAWDTSYGPMAGSPFCAWVNAAAYQDLTSTEIAPTMGPVWTSCYNDGANDGVNVAGVTNTQVATVQPAVNSTIWYLGGRTGGFSRGVVLSRMCSSAAATKCVAQNNTAPSAAVWVADSIGTGSVSSPTMPPAELSALAGKTVYNKGVPGTNAATCAAVVTNKVIGKGYATLLWLCGTNDTLAGSVPAAHTAWTATQTSAEAALASGMKVLVFNILPYKNSASWNTNNQTALAAYNSDFTAWCASVSGNPKVYCIDAYTAFGGGTGGVCTGSDPACLLNAYDSGDGRHPNALGSVYLATLANAGAP